MKLNSISIESKKGEYILKKDIEKLINELMKEIKLRVQKYTDPKPEYDGITWNNIIKDIKL